MLAETSYLAAFLVGLFGGVHCVGMCGGIVGALAFGLREEVRGRTAALIPYLLSYNAGRLLSYTAAGALLGGVGALATNLVLVHQARLAMQAVAGLFMVALGLYLGGWWSGLLRLERAGGVFWRRIEPLGRRLLPVATPARAFALGLVWGWLPCGLVYSVLIWAIAAGDALRGGLLMFCFGLGTLPLLLAMGVPAGRLSTLMRGPRARRAAGALVLAFGLYSLARLLDIMY